MDKPQSNSFFSAMNIAYWPGQTWVMHLRLIVNRMAESIYSRSMLWGSTCPDPGLLLLPMDLPVHSQPTSNKHIALLARDTNHAQEGNIHRGVSVFYKLWGWKMVLCTDVSHRSRFNRIQEAVHKIIPYFWENLIYLCKCCFALHALNDLVL